MTIPSALVLTMIGLSAVSSVALAQNAPATGAAPGQPVQSDLDDPSFRSAVQGTPGLTLSPEMIRELGRRFKENKNASEEVMAPSIAMPVTRSVNASLGPGGATSIIQAVQGYPTALAFVDATGQPWPIAWDTNSNPASDSTGNGGAGGVPAVQATGFDIRVPLKGSNVLQLAPRSSAPRGGVLVNLQGAPAPLTFMIMSGRDRYDARVDVRVADRGPNAKVQIITRPDTPETGAAYLTAMLDGAPPAEAVPLSVSGVSPDDVRAWRLGDKVYLRTQYTILSPEWTAEQHGPNNVAIYAIPATPVVLLSANGRSVAARLTEQ